MGKLRILCAECFNQITDIKKGIATCSCCGAEYNIAEKSTQFKVRLTGGYIKEKLSYDDVKQTAEKVKIKFKEIIKEYISII